MARRRKPPVERVAGTLQVVLARTFAMIRSTRLERLTSLAVEVPDDMGNRWRVQFTRVKPKQAT